MEILRIQKSMRKNYRYTHRVIQKMVDRDIDDPEIREAIEGGEIIEEYPRDKYGPACLIFGYTRKHRPLHVLITYSDSPWIVTVYEPGPKEWINYYERRKK